MLARNITSWLGDNLLGSQLTVDSPCTLSLRRDKSSNWNFSGVEGVEFAMLIMVELNVLYDH